MRREGAKSVGRGKNAQNAGDRLVAAARRYIEEHSAEKFSLQAVAGALYVNGSYLLRIFKARTGSTLLQYHNAVRCEKAKALLAQGDKSVSQAGEETGFVSSAHFSHVFKKITGMTPTQYRVQCEGQGPD